METNDQITTTTTTTATDLADVETGVAGALRKLVASTRTLRAHDRERTFARALAKLTPAEKKELGLALDVFGPRHRGFGW